MSAETSIGGRVGRGFAWSAVNTTVVRLGSLAVSIVLARLLSPEQFGVFAVALTVQTIVATVADLGVSADLVRSGRIDERGPTAATVALLASASLALLVWVTATPVAAALGDAHADGVVRAMAVVLLLNGLTVVPTAVIQREFLQSRQFAVDGVGLVVTSVVTIALVLLGVGAMSLALGRVAGQLVTTLLQYRLARVRPRFGWDRDVARESVAFGGPLAAANLLSWVVISVDNIVVGNRLGSSSLGLYVMAFNLSSWPLTIVGTAVRSVALPAFSRFGDASEAAFDVLSRAVGLCWALALPLGLGLVVFARPVVSVVYGDAWAGAAVALAALGGFGALRVVFDVVAAFLFARGSAVAVLVVQAAWLVLLVPGMLVGIHVAGLAGAGWAHLVVGVVLIAPLYAVVLRRHGSALRLLAPAVHPAAAVTVAGLLGWWVGHHTSAPLLQLLLGGPVFVLAYGVLMAPYLRRLRRAGLAGLVTVPEVEEPPASHPVPAAVPALAEGDR